jgi:hypothetical protein
VRRTKKPKNCELPWPEKAKREWENVQQRGHLQKVKENVMGWENFRQKSGCLCVKAKDEATIREAVKNGTMMKYPHYACPLSCPCKICEFIENKEDPKFLLQDLVEEGGEKIKKERKDKAEKAVKDLKDPDGSPPEAENMMSNQTIAVTGDIDRLFTKDEGQWGEEDVPAPVKEKGR